MPEAGATLLGVVMVTLRKALPPLPAVMATLDKGMASEVVEIA